MPYANRIPSYYGHEHIVDRKDDHHLVVRRVGDEGAATLDLRTVSWVEPTPLWTPWEAEFRGSIARRARNVR